jgi:NAD-dependent SIR2 family protein deacetylase
VSEREEAFAEVDEPERCEGCDQMIPDDGDKHYDDDDVLLCVDCMNELRADVAAMHQPKPE